MKIEIWSDVVCPWCYIGKHRLEAALKGFDGDVDIVWRSFELDPGAPATPKQPLDVALASKYDMSLERARQMMDQVARTAAEDGLELNFSITRGGNTFDAHRLVHFAAGRDKQGEMKERLFRAYMTEGRPISDRDELATLAGDVGLEPHEVRAMFKTDACTDGVRRDEARARQLGIRGVPFFLIDGSHGVSGAQASEVLLGELEQIRARAAAEMKPDGQVCVDDTCIVPDD